MASGSTKGFDFASDDILCSYEDYPNQENSNGNHSDSAIGTNSSKEFNKSRMARSSVFPASSYSPPDDAGDQDAIISAVERSMKNCTDNLMRFLEGISSRLSQLELYCYNLDKSIGEMRSELARDHGDSDSKLKFLEKHLQEVHRSVQILRDKQELADTQKELAKLQLAQKESSSGHSSQQNDEAEDLRGQQLALALTPAPAPAPAPVPQQPMSQSQAYYLPPAQLSNVLGPTQLTQNQYLHPDSHYRPPPPPAPQSQAAQQQPQVQSLPQYQQQWGQQVQPQPQPSVQPGVRPVSPQVYPSYHQSQPANPPPHEPPQNSIPMQMSYPGVPQPSSSQAMQYPYAAPGRTAQPPQPQPQPPQHLKASSPGPPGDRYAPSGPQGNTYVLYDSESGRVQHPSQQSHFPQAGYPPNPQQTTARPPHQFVRNHPYNELMEKLMSMGYRGDHVMSVIQRLEETGQVIDFNTVLDRLNGHGPQRGWSG